jgi:hypothetical protein
MQHRSEASDEKVSQLLGALSPDPADRPDPRKAFSQFKTRIEIERRDEYTMFGLKISRKAQRVLAAGLAVVALVGLLAIPQVGALASEFLSVFRVQRFVLVNVTQERMDQIQKAVGKDSNFIAHETVKEPGDPKSAASLDEAAQTVGFTPLTPDASYGEPTKVLVSGLGVERFRPDAKALQSLFSSLNMDPGLIPDSIDGQPFDITIQPGVEATYDVSKEGFGVAQFPSPTVNVPDGVDMEKLGEAMFQLFGMTPQEAAHMSKTIDWTSTLVVPIPSDLNTMREVTVRGTSGLLYDGSNAPKGKGGKNAKGPDGESMPEYKASVVWQANGTLYVVTGPSADAVLALAESLH